MCTGNRRSPSISYDTKKGTDVAICPSFGINKSILQNKQFCKYFLPFRRSGQMVRQVFLKIVLKKLDFTHVCWYTVT